MKNAGAAAAAATGEPEAEAEGEEPASGGVDIKRGGGVEGRCCYVCIEGRGVRDF